MLYALVKHNDNNNIEQLSYKNEQECDGRPVVIGGALCSTPQSLADAQYWTRASEQGGQGVHVTLTRGGGGTLHAFVPQGVDRSNGAISPLNA